MTITVWIYLVFILVHLYMSNITLKLSTYLVFTQFSSQKPVLLFGISFHSACVLRTHSFSSSPKCRLVLEPNPNSYSKGYQDFFPNGVKWPGHEVDHSPPLIAKAKNKWSYISTPPTCLHGVYRHNFTFF
jgi:hypothetical protein